MRDLRYETLTKDHLDIICKLLISRQNQENKEYSFLKDAIHEISDVKDHFSKVIDSENLIGVVAFKNDIAVGYIYGLTYKKEHGKSFVHVPYEGLAAITKQSSDIIKYMYKEVSKQWVNQGFFIHYLMMPLGHKEHLDSAHQLGFSIEQAYAAMSTDTFQPFLIKNTDASIRKYHQQDAAILEKLAFIVAEHQNQAPIFVSYHLDNLKTRKEAFRNLVNDSDVCELLILEKDNHPIGFQLYEYVSKNLMIPDMSVELVVAGILNAFKGKNLGKALMNHAIESLKSKNYKYIVTDWKPFNLEASTFWQKCGFIPYVYLMKRTIDSDYRKIDFNDI